MTSSVATNVDVAVIGAGPSGVVEALRAARLGARTPLMTRDALRGMAARASVMAIGDELTQNGFVLRYRTDETDDGLSGKEGKFVLCSFWLVSALAIIGETRRARDQMARLVKVASPLGLYAEEFDVETGRHSATSRRPSRTSRWWRPPGRIIVAERLAEISA
ncbi:MAG: glycoside hydrolase family 15 protein [Solirubrobacteraceae bacterium]